MNKDIYKQNKIALVMTSSDTKSKQRIVRNLRALHNNGYCIVVASPYQASDLSMLSIPIYLNTQTAKSKNKRFVSRVEKKIRNFYVDFLLVQAGLQFQKISDLYYEKKYSHNIVNIEKDLNNKLTIILVEEIQLLPYAIKISKCARKRIKIVVDLRDFYWNDSTFVLKAKNKKNFFFSVFSIFRHFKNHSQIKLFYKRLLPLVDNIMVVSKGHRDQLRELFDIDSNLVMSLPDYIPMKCPTPVNDNDIKVVYHGAAKRKRKIEILMNAIMNAQQNVSLHLYLTLTDSNTEYIEELKMISNERIFFYHPLPYEELIKITAEYDIGIAFFPPLDSTLKFALPNKFFEYIQSRLAVIVGPTPDMAEIVNVNKNGIVVPDFTVNQLCKKLSGLNAKKVYEMKLASHKAALKFCHDSNRGVISKILND